MFSGVGWGESYNMGGGRTALRCEEKVKGIGGGN